MSLVITSTKNASTPSGEYIILHATTALNLKNYAVVDRTFNADGSVSNEHRHIFFFPAKELKKDEWVVLYSGTGTNGTPGKFSNTGDTYYAYYWQSGSCIWNNDGRDSASVINYTPGNSMKVAAV